MSSTYTCGIRSIREIQSVLEMVEEEQLFPMEARAGNIGEALWMK